MSNSFPNRLRNHDLAIGNLGPCISTSATPEVWDFIIKKTVEGKYTSVAEYMIDVLIEEYFREQ